MESNTMTTYKDLTPAPKVDKKTLNKMVWMSTMLQASFNYERMQSSGWLWAMLPGLQKIHTNKDDLAASMTHNMDFINTHPYLVTFVMGIVLSMEQQKMDIQISILCYVGGTAMADTLQQIATDYSWFTAGLTAAGGMMKFVGFAILMKIMMASDLWGFLLAGFASAIILSYIPTGFAFNAEAGSVAASGTMSGVALLLLSFIGICIAIYDFMINIKIKENAGSNAGGMSDGI